MSLVDTSYLPGHPLLFNKYLKMKNLKIYLFTVVAIGILSCSGDDLNNDSGADSENDLVSSNFIPTIESWNTLPLNSAEWIHETNSDGELVKSSMYEKYPRRLLWELEYLDYNEDHLPTEYEKIYYSYGEAIDFVTWDVTYNENGTIEGITAYRDGSFSHEYFFTQLDDKNRVKSYQYFGDTGEFMERVVYEYDEKGNHKSATLYNTESGSDNSEFIEKWDYSFTHLGDRESTYYIHRESGSTTEFTYSYRENYTLESRLRISNSEGYPDSISYTEFDEEEKISSESVTYGDQQWEYVAFFPSGYVEIIEFYFQDVLMWVQTFQEDRSSEVKVFNPDDGTYRIEFLDPEGTVYKVEYYDADDNLINTEHYSRSIQVNKPPTRIENNLYLEIYPGRENARK